MTARQPAITYGPPRRRGMLAIADSLSVTYPHLYRCVVWLNGDTAKGRKPGMALEASIRERYPELIQTKGARPC